MLMHLLSLLKKIVLANNSKNRLSSAIFPRSCSGKTFREEGGEELRAARQQEAHLLH